MCVKLVTYKNYAHLCTRKTAEDCTSETSARIYRGKGQWLHFRNVRTYLPGERLSIALLKRPHVSTGGKADDCSSETSASTYRGKAEDCNSETSARIYRGKGWWLHFRNVRMYLPGKGWGLHFRNVRTYVQERERLRTNNRAFKTSVTTY